MQQRIENIKARVNLLPFLLILVLTNICTYSSSIGIFDGKRRLDIFILLFIRILQNNKNMQNSFRICRKRSTAGTYCNIVDWAVTTGKGGQGRRPLNKIFAFPQNAQHARIQCSF